MVVAGEDAGPKGFGMTVQNMSTIFCIENGILNPLWLEMMQEALDVLTDLFDKVRMRTNM